MDIVMVPFHDYKKWIREGFRTRDAHLCQHLEKKKEIDKMLVVNRPTSLAELIAKRTMWKTSAGKIEYDKAGICLTKMSEKVWCIDFLLPDLLKVAIERKTWWFTAFQYSRVLTGINDAMEYLQLQKSILLLQNPMAIGAAQNVNCNVFVFDAIDNWLYHPQMQNRELIKRNYDYVNVNADLIFTVSESLTHTFPDNKNVKWIPNGVDIDYFSRARLKHNTKQKVVIGYVGKIQDRVDFNLVERCAETYEDCEFVFLGPVYSHKDKVKKMKKTHKNIIFKGDIHYTKLPDEMKIIDIALIPHTVDKFTNSMNPLKLYEYLAAGKIVVSTQVAGINNISDFVFSARSDDEYVRLLGSAIELVRKGQLNVNKIAESIPDECSWEHRVDVIVRELETAMKG